MLVSINGDSEIAFTVSEPLFRHNAGWCSRQGYCRPRCGEESRCQTSGRSDSSQIALLDDHVALAFAGQSDADSKKNKDKLTDNDYHCLMFSCVIASVFGCHFQIELEQKKNWTRPIQ